MRLLIFGPQGAGKGTQAQLLADHPCIPHISTGDVFRANIKAGTALGQQVGATIAAGELVADWLTQALVADRLGQPDTAGGFLLDGFPRTIEQATWLDATIRLPSPCSGSPRSASGRTRDLMFQHRYGSAARMEHRTIRHEVVPRRVEQPRQRSTATKRHVLRA